MKDIDYSNMHELTDIEYRKINGGVGIGASILVAVAVTVGFHIAKEAYNDWDAHVDAFIEGMEAAK